MQVPAPASINLESKTALLGTLRFSQKNIHTSKPFKQTIPTVTHEAKQCNACIEISIECSDQKHI